MYISEKVKKRLTDDDLKVIKHMVAIDNLFKKGDTSIRLFSAPYHILITKIEDEQEYELFSFGHIPHDGGDPDYGFGYGCIASPEDYVNEYCQDDEGN